MREYSEPSLGPGRREARERAVGLLYESALKELTVAEVLGALPLEPASYTIAALHGIADDRDAIDGLIDEHARGWNVERLPQVDRAILRLAVWELTDRHDVPAAVVIDEAVELAKEYSTERSPNFINGVLDAIASAVEGQRS